MFYFFFCRTSVLFVSITFIVLMIISLTWLVFYYVQRFRYIRTKDKMSVSMPLDLNVEIHETCLVIFVLCNVLGEKFKNYCGIRNLLWSVCFHRIGSGMLKIQIMVYIKAKKIKITSEVYIFFISWCT